MIQVMQHLETNYADAQVRRAREPLLAAALVHDVGHGPFSHLFEPCLGVDHEEWSRAIIESPETSVHKALRACDRSLPRTVGELVDPENRNHPAWQRCLLSSQLDMDRLDYLRRDSLFTGADYGHFDWYRLINSLELYDDGESSRDIVWPEKACLGIEEFIFARYYMYHNVYLHKTTRGFEKLLEAMWFRAKSFFDQGKDALLVPAIRDFWTTPEPSVAQYTTIEEFTVLQQIQNWTSHEDKALSDLARRFLNRERLAMIDAPDFEGKLDPDVIRWGQDLKKLVSSRVEYDPPEAYCLVDRVKAKYYQPYFPEKEGDEQSVKNAIRVLVEGESTPIEISSRLTRLKPVTEAPAEKVRYYVPKDLQNDAQRLRANWK
jgi:HD superfamily phosphohydrolase